MSKPTVRDIAETCMGLAQVAARLREAAGAPPVAGSQEHVVLANVQGLLADAQFIETVVSELGGLLPDEPVELSED